MIHRDNTFGTPEEDAFRRDFTINGLFYDIATFSVIDYVGGLADLERRLVRSIGDPRVRFVEDPVRMLRAAVMAARLGFDFDPLVVDAIAEHRELILKASPARLLEEYYKILRSGAAEATFRKLGDVGLLPLITPELRTPPVAFWESLARLDRYRRAFTEPPPELTNTTLIGAVLAPLGLLGAQPRYGRDAARRSRHLRDPADCPQGSRSTAAGHAPRAADRRTDLCRSAWHAAWRTGRRSAAALTWVEIFGDVPAHRRRVEGSAISTAPAPQAGEAAPRLDGVPADEERKTPPAPDAGAGDDPSLDRRRHESRGAQPCFFSNSRMNATSAWTPSSGNAL